MVGRITGSETNLWQRKRKLLDKGKKQTSGNPNTKHNSVKIQDCCKRFIQTRVKLAINVTENVSGQPFCDTIRSVSWLWGPIREIPHNSPLETPEETPLSISPSFARLGVISHMSPRTCPNTQMFPGILENEAVFLFRRFFWKTAAALSPSPNMWTVVLYCPLKILCRPDRAYFLKFWKIEDCINLSILSLVFLVVYFLDPAQQQSCEALFWID